MKILEWAAVAAAGYVGYTKYTTGMWPWDSTWTDNLNRAWTVTQLPTGLWSAMPVPPNPKTTGVTGAPTLAALQASLNSMA